MLEKIDAELREGALGHAGVVEDARHEASGLGLVEEALALVNDAGEKFAADVVEHPQADPRHFVGVEVGEKAAEDHHERHEQAGPQDGVDARSRARGGRLGNFLVIGPAGENALPDKSDDQGDRAVDEREEHAHRHAKDKAAFVGFDVGKQLEVGLPGGAESGRFR